MLRIHLREEAGAPGERTRLRARYHNAGTEPLALTFWWNRVMQVRDADGRLVSPGPGPVLPCGAMETWEVLAPGESVDRDEPLLCTQPAGLAAPVGWAYALGPGRWRVVLVYESPAPHGFSQSPPHPLAFKGRVESNEVTLTVAPSPPTGLRALLARLLR